MPCKRSTTKKDVNPKRIAARLAPSAHRVTHTAVTPPPHAALFRIARYDAAKAPSKTVAPTNGNQRYPALAITAPPTDVPIA